MKKIAIVFAVLTLALCLSTVVSACEVPSAQPSITLSPPQGFAVTTITGTDFCGYDALTVSYDGVAQPTIPAQIQTDSQGAFTAMISIPDELAVGAHTITVIDPDDGYSVSATFTVVDMKGPQGPQGLQGVAGQNGNDGLNGADGANGLSFNGTGNIFVYNGTNGQNGLDFNATSNTYLYNGTNGLNGQNGLNGNDGRNGINGVNGVNGKDGANGVGYQGPQGPSGTIIYADPPTIGFDSFIAVIVIALVAFTVAMLLANRKSRS